MSQCTCDHDVDDPCVVHSQSNEAQEISMRGREADRIDPHFASVIRQIVKLTGLRKVRELLDLIEREGGVG